MDDDLERRIVLDALVSYADACTLPALTPTCPFYIEVEGRPTCGEQCREIAQARGAEPRRVRSKDLGGLVLLGRELPARSVAGADDFDAAEIRLRYERDEPFQQPTTSLLVGLREAIVTGAFEGAANTSAALAYWGELDRRGFPIENVAANGMVDAIANAIALSVTVPILISAGVTPLQASDAVDSQLNSPHREAWTNVLRETFNAAQDQRRERLHAFTPDPPTLRRRLGSLIAPEVSDTEFEAVIEAEPFLAFVQGLAAQGRIAAWLAHLFETDLDAALSTRPPEHFETFAAFPLRGRDEVAEWLTDRFLLTDLNRWGSTSLTLEWRHLSGHRDTECPVRVLAERSLDRSTVGERALATLGERSPRRIEPEPLSPSLFVYPAQLALGNRQWDTAIGIFHGLTRMMPADHEAWNNLGFCQLAVDPGTALDTLEHASRMRHGNTSVSVANRVLALHRLNRDEEALALADQCLALPVTRVGVAVMWKHPSDEPNSLVDDVDPYAYLASLRLHISASLDSTGACN